MQRIDIAHQSCALFVTVNSEPSFLGSAFFFLYGGEVLAATADHVIGEASGRFVMAAGDMIFEVDVLKRCPDYDLCVLGPKSHPDGVSLQVSSDRGMSGNVTLYTYEYSTTDVFPDGSFHLTPATRIGNCTRIVQLEEQYGHAGIDMLELSFPALRGASGAPVIEIRGSEMIVHGIIVANAERHLLPAEIETVLDEKNEILEERKYFLPQAVAVNTTHLVRELDVLAR